MTGPDTKRESDHSPNFSGIAFFGKVRSMTLYKASSLPLLRASSFRLRNTLGGTFLALAFSAFAQPSHAQQVATLNLPAALPEAPDPQGTQTGSITGTVMDTDGLVVPGATIVVTGPDAADRRTATSAADGTFVVTGVRSGVSCKVVISAKLFADFTPADIQLGPGQSYDIANIKLPLASVDTSITALTPEALAIEQENEELHQRILGILPNFYVVYDHAFAPLPPKLKFKLALKSSFDVVNLGSALFLGGINQAAREPDYRSGLIGYGERVGAVYVDGVTNIIFGGAVLPVLLHQDPRYFYEGTGSNKKTRFRHAILTPFICRGDNGKSQFNYSSIGGDFISAGISNAYYPPHDRGVGLVFQNVAISTAGRMVNALAQEFVLLKLTNRAKPKPRP